VGGALSGNSCNSAKFGVAQWVDEWVCSRISVHCQQQLLRDLVAHQKHSGLSIDLKNNLGTIL